MESERELRDQVRTLLFKAPASSDELAAALNTSEGNVLIALYQLRAEHTVELVSGKWSLTDEYKSKTPQAA